MCEFISWIKKGNKVYFLTHELLYNTPRGEILRKQFNSDKPDDFYGHNAIKKYFELHDGLGIEKECTDFSTPDNFPAVIVKAIKEGKLRGLAQPELLLTNSAQADYDKIVNPARADYYKIVNSAQADYYKIVNSAQADYDKIVNSAWADYNKIVNPARADYYKIVNSAQADYDKIVNSAWADYNKIVNPARADYYKIKQNAFWDLFANPDNRAKAWR